MTTTATATASVTAAASVAIKDQIRQLLPFLDPDFLLAMNDIGQYGYEKYGSVSFYAQAQRGDHRRPNDRLSTSEIIKHAQIHGQEYSIGLQHDHFQTLTHQLAAMSFNAMMEYYYADLTMEALVK
jgi:hypothetical protein